MSNLTQNPCWKEHGNLFLDSILDLFVSSAILALQELMIYTTMVSCACQVRKNMVAMVKTTVRYLNIICVCKSRVQQFLPQTHDGVTCFTNWLHLVTWSIAKSRKGNNKIWSAYRYHSSPIHEGKSLVIELQAVFSRRYNTSTGSPYYTHAQSWLQLHIIWQPSLLFGLICMVCILLCSI